MKKLSTKKKSQSWYRKKCVEIAKDKAKERDGYKCRHCGSTKEQGWRIHGSHIYSEGIYKSMSADIDNIIALCAKCHVGGGAWANKSTQSWHEDPMYFSDWFRDKYPELAKTLRLRSQKVQVINWEARYKEMKELSTAV